MRTGCSFVLAGGSISLFFFPGYVTRAGSPLPTRYKPEYRHYAREMEPLGDSRHQRSPFLRRPDGRDLEFDRRRGASPRGSYNHEYSDLGRSRGRESPIRRSVDQQPYEDIEFNRRRFEHRQSYGFDSDQARAEVNGRESWNDRARGARYRDISPVFGRNSGGGGRGGRGFRNVSPPGYAHGRANGKHREFSPPPYGRGGGFRDFSPPPSRMRDGQPPIERGLDGAMIRNDPNLVPRAGDWICKNPP